MNIFKMDDNMITLPAGKYLIGDMCYRDNDIWDQMIDNAMSKAHQLRSGRKYVNMYTAYGDGCYMDQNGNEYWVDSGTIGILQWDFDENLDIPQGRTFDFAEAFQVYNDNGVLHFGHIIINTDPDDGSTNPLMEASSSIISMT